MTAPIGFACQQDALLRVGKTSGIGYKLEHVIRGQGGAYTEISVKEGFTAPHAAVVCYKHYPSLFDSDAPEMSEEFLVFCGKEHQDLWYPLLKKEPVEPPARYKSKPPGTSWQSFAPDGDIDWMLSFGKRQKAAENYAAKLTTTFVVACGDRAVSAKPLVCAH